MPEQSPTQEPISELDYLFFHKIASFYHALTISATDPVAVPSDLAQEQEIDDSRIGAFSHQFYDTLDDEAEGLRIMQARIRFVGADIQRHNRLHQKMLYQVGILEEAINTNNRDVVARGVESLLGGVSALSLLVANHKGRAFDLHKRGDPSADFLHYPTCVSGHYFYLKEAPYLLECAFNPLQTPSGTAEEVSALKQMLPDFLIGNYPTTSIRLSDTEDLGEGVFDTSYRGRLALNVELLRRAGLDLPSNA